MGTGTVHLTWLKEHLMVGTDSFGRGMVIGSAPSHDPKWTGLKPSDLLLLAAASCASYDVVEILQKQRAPLTGLEIACEGTQLAEPPYTFTHIHLRYTIIGAVEPQKIERAIALAQDKYCSVISTLRPQVQITHEFTVRAE